MMQQLSRLSCLAVHRRNSAFTPPPAAARSISTSKQHNYKVAVVRAAGGVGQPLSLLLKRNPLVTRLDLLDNSKDLTSMVADLSQIESGCKVRAYGEPAKLALALNNANVVVITTGELHEPGMTDEDVFKNKADFIMDTVYGISRYSPDALIAIITNPLNCFVPIAAEVLKEQGVYDPKRLFGVTTLDTIRARTFVGNALSIDSRWIQVPVIGGQSSATTIPVMSQCKLAYDDSQGMIKEFMKFINAGGESTTLSMAYAGSRFIDSLLRGLDGEEDVIECAYVESNVTKARFFSNPLLLGQSGIEENLGLPRLEAFERELLDSVLPLIEKDIEMGLQFVEEKRHEIAKGAQLTLEQKKKEIRLRHKTKKPKHKVKRVEQEEPEQPEDLVKEQWLAVAQHEAHEKLIEQQKEEKLRARQNKNKAMEQDGLKVEDENSGQQQQQLSLKDMQMDKSGKQKQQIEQNLAKEKKERSYSFVISYAGAR